MLVFVSGAARSGKSAWAEEYARGLAQAGGAPGSLVYLATAGVWDQEMRERVSRHQEARKDKGFATLERQTNVSECAPLIGRDATVLLECLGTLLANEMFGPIQENEREARTKRDSQGTQFLEQGLGQSPRSVKYDLAAKICTDILVLKNRAANLLIVSNDIFSDGATYDAETENYIRTLGKLHIKLAAQADQAVEYQCGSPWFHKSVRVWA